MSTVSFRYDYAKFVLTHPRGLFALYYHRLNELSHERKFYGDWLKSHKVTAWPSQDPELETTCVEIWGEWAGLIEDLNFGVWAPALRRLDVRAVLWDVGGDAILHTGQAIQRAGCGFNVEVFNSRPASKRHGRDRGGQGFRIGSRKSDICCVVYRRTGEPSALEFRFQGQALRNLVTEHFDLRVRYSTVASAWLDLKQCAADKGDRRINQAYEHAGIGSYWPTYAQVDADGHSPLQSSFTAMRAGLGTDPDAQWDPSAVTWPGDIPPAE